MHYPRFGPIVLPGAIHYPRFGPIVLPAANVLPTSSGLYFAIAAKRGRIRNQQLSQR
jgi:hypothetical protein